MHHEIKCLDKFWLYNILQKVTQLNFRMLLTKKQESKRVLYNL
jgi:hypothetical protein